MIEWLSNNWFEVVEVVGLIVTTSTAIARLTPTTKDDNVVEKIRKVFEKISTMFLPDRK